MLLGEHAVVYNHPCLVTAVGQRMRVTAAIDERSNFTLVAKNVGIHGHEKPMSDLGKGNVEKNVRFVEIAVKNFAEKFPFKEGVRIETTSEFSSHLGFGSSSAVTVCMIKALSELFSVKLENKEIFELAYKTVLDIQGKGSGFDIAAAIYGGTLYFVTGGKEIKQLAIKNLPMVVGYSRVKADTVVLINKVAEVSKKYPVVVDSMYRNIEKIVKLGAKALREKDWITFGQLMNMNQGFLESLGVSTWRLSSMIYAARDAEAYGAKLSGAGGGDCMIAFTSDEKKQGVIDAITRAGGEYIDVATNVEGVRIEI